MATTTTSTRSAQAGPLNSDHVNYLIFRYLQESGFEKASEALWRDWHRRPEYRDPETLPFAHAVKRHELISVIQDGLYHDELQARRRGQEGRRFRWTGQQTGEGMRSLENEGVDEDNGSRPASRGKRKMRVPVLRPQDEFPVPAPKRQRRSDGLESTVNGESMDIDAKTPASTSAEEIREHSGDATSPPAEDDQELVEPTERYDSMDVATQTEIKVGPKTSTLYLELDRPDNSILHASWQPSTTSTESHTLLATGGNLCRFYSIPAITSDVANLVSVSHFDEQVLRSSGIIAAMAWHPDGETVTCAIDGSRDLPEGGVELDQKIVDISRRRGTHSYQLGPPLQEPPGIVLSIKYNVLGTHVAVLSSNDKRGLVQVWETTGMNVDMVGKSSEPIAWRIFEHKPLEVEWVGSQSFVVCGEQGLLKQLRLTKVESSEINGLRTPESYTTDDLLTHGLVEEHLRPLEEHGTATLEKLRYEADLDILVLCASDVGRLVAVRSPSDLTSIHSASDIGKDLTSLVFQPPQHSAEGPTTLDSRSALFAATFASGVCSLCRIELSDQGAPTVSDVAHLAPDQGAILNAAWTSDGQHLAVAGLDFVQIWDLETIAQPSTSSTRLRHEARVSWRPDVPFKRPIRRNGEFVDEERVTPPCLSWSSDGQALAFAWEQQIAIISFRPPLAKPLDLSEVATKPASP